MPIPSCKDLLPIIRYSGYTQADDMAKTNRLMYKYEIILYWSNDDDAFVAEVPELLGCMAHGDTQEAALKHINQAMALWIDTAKEFGDLLPEREGKRRPT